MAVELGTGTIAFEPLEDEAEIGLVTGPQGGHHVIVHARARSLDPGDPLDPSAPGNPHTVFLAFDLDGERLDMRTADYTLGYLADGDWYVLPSGRLMIMNEDVLPTIGDRVRLRVELTDRSGETAASELVVRIADGGTTRGDAGLPDGDADSGP